MSRNATFFTHEDLSHPGSGISAPGSSAKRPMLHRAMLGRQCGSDNKEATSDQTHHSTTLHHAERSPHVPCPIAHNRSI
uniref:Uncharacterized protein n=1 Tax=Steinernema glaseri TaxID=37863 RepID=A0A1I7YYC9_9BILA